MTSQPQPAPGEVRPVGQYLRPLRDLAAWALVLAPAVMLFVAFIRLIPAGDGEQFVSRTQNSFYDFVNVATIFFPLAAVLLALLVTPPHPKAKVITVVALVEYGVAAFFGVVFGILVGLIQVGRFSVRAAFEELLVRAAWLTLFALAALAVYRIWRGLFHVPRPVAQPGVYGQPQYGVPGTYPGQPGYGPPPGTYGGQPQPQPQPGQPGPGQPGFGQAQPGFGPAQPDQGQPGHGGFSQAQPGQGQPGHGGFGQAQTGQPGFGLAQPGQSQAGHSQTGQPQPGQPGFGGQPSQPGWGQQPAYGEAPHGQAIYGEAAYGRPAQDGSQWGQPPVSAQPASAQPAPASAPPVSAQPAPGTPPGPYAPGQAPATYGSHAAQPPSPGAFGEPTQAVPRPDATTIDGPEDRTEVVRDDRPGYGPADDDRYRR